MDEDLIQGLRRHLLEGVGALLQGRRRVALVDFPNHPNVGDSAIWLGEVELLRQLGIAPVYTCDTLTYSRSGLARALGSDGVILLHGGGNLGDVWPHHQALRERVVRDFSDRPIIQLPQSIQFHSEEGLARAREAFDAHPDLTLLCRDRYSLDFAREHFRCRSELAPDSAFMLDLRPLRGEADHDVMYLARSDVEKGDDQAHLEDLSVLRCDWLEEPRTPLIRLSDALSRQLVRRPSLDPLLRRPVSATYTPMAWQRVRRGCALLSRGRVVVTDRLHAHILSLLMGIPHVFMDNNYGKNRRFFEVWTRDAELAHWCDDPRRAGKMARELLAAQGRGE